MSGSLSPLKEAPHRYLDLYRSGELLRRVKAGYARLACCDLCPHACGVNRLTGEVGLCGGGKAPRIASACIHQGEEPPISGSRGSGTIFLSGCTLNCRFCQNFPISQLNHGKELSTGELAKKMLVLEAKGAHNINFVTPSHFTPQILRSLHQAIRQGFRLPLVWNTSGYERLDTLQLLDGVVDIYLPDMKYASETEALNLSLAPGYPELNRIAVAEMLRQVGQLQTDCQGIATSGVIVRHLLLPKDRGGSAETLAWVAANLGTATPIALMSQYFPAHLAIDAPGLNRRVTRSEYLAAVKALESNELGNGWLQEEPQQG